MPNSADTLIAERYKLVERLGAGGMGEVWKAQDTNFSRPVVVAVKLLKEDETVADDNRNRSNLILHLEREAAAGHLTFELVVNAFDEMFNVGVNRTVLQEVAKTWFAGRELSAESALAFYDEIVDDGTFNENARQRRRLRELFDTEANSVAVLQHPHIVRVTDYGEHEGLPFLVMDFISGRTLQQVIQRREPMEVSRRLRLMEDLCEGLAYAHSKDLIHRDIKPANLIIDGETQRLKILDFGVARTMQVSALRSVSLGAPIGTYCYMSPEQTRASRTLDNRSDIFSVGLVLYELLGYQRAFPSAGDINELLGRIQRDPPPPLRRFVPDLEHDLEAIVYKAIEKVPARRYPDLLEMQRAIENVRRRIEEAERRQTNTGGVGTQIARFKPIPQQITDLVDRATSAFGTGDDHAVIEFSDQILSLRPGQPDAVELKERARDRIKLRLVEASINEARALLDRGELEAAARVIDEAQLDNGLAVVRRLTDDLAAAQAAERHKRIDGALVEAEIATSENRLDDAIRALSAAAGDPRVDAKLAEAERVRDARLARERAIGDALSRARELIAAEDFDQAREILAEAKTIDPDHQEMADLRRWLRPIVKAIGQLDDALSLFDQGAMTAGEVALAQSREVLGAHTAEFPSIGRRLASAEASRAAAGERDRERRRMEAEQGKVASDIDTTSRRIRAALAEDRFEDAETELITMARLPASDGAIIVLRQELAKARARALERGADQRCKEARALIARGELDEALALLRAFAPPHPAVTAEIEAVGKAIYKRDEDRIRAEEIARARLAAERLAAAEADRARRQAEREQLAERQRQEDEQARRHLEDRVNQTLSAADVKFLSGRRGEALAMLRQFEPRHPRVTARLELLQKEIEKMQVATRAADESGRLLTQQKDPSTRGMATAEARAARAAKARRQQAAAVVAVLVVVVLLAIVVYLITRA